MLLSTHERGKTGSQDVFESKNFGLSGLGNADVFRAHPGQDLGANLEALALATA